MTFQKGRSGNINGRPDGALSKKTKDHISRTQELYDAMRQHKRFNTFLDTMSDGDFARLLVNVVEFLEPKLARTEHVDRDGGVRTVKVIHSLQTPQKSTSTIEDAEYIVIPPIQAIPVETKRPF